MNIARVKWGLTQKQKFVFDLNETEIVGERFAKVLHSSSKVVRSGDVRCSDVILRQIRVRILRPSVVSALDNLQHL